MSREIKILFHGASVTQQGGDSGYFTLLERKFSAGSPFKIRRRTYGGCHLDDAGFVNISSDIISATDICILEWNSTGLSEFNPLKLNYIVGTLLSNGITPVFLILPSDQNIKRDRACEVQVRNLCLTVGLVYLDYRGYVDPEIHLCDNVHTNNIGAEIYSDHLFGDINSLFSSFSSGLPRANFEYFNFDINPRRGVDINAVEGSGIIVELTRADQGCQLLAEVICGPASPVISIEGGGSLCIWDRWSHYERGSFVSLWLGPGGGVRFFNKDKRSLGGDRLLLLR